MYVVVTFKYSFNLELVISELVKYGYDSKRVLAFPLQPFHRSSTIKDMVSEDSTTLFDLALVLGTIGMLLGVIYGNVLAWGAILWGLIGLVSGGGVGLLITLALYFRSKRKLRQSVNREVVLMIRLLEQDRVSELEEILRPYEPTGIATLDRSTPPMERKQSAD